MNRTLVFILGMIFGIIFLFAAIGVGAYVAVTVVTPSMVSEDFSNSLGIIGDMSLLDIYDEVTNMYKNKNITKPNEDGKYYSLGEFATEYSVDLATVFGFEPTEELLEIPLFSLFAEGGFGIVMDNTTVDAIFSILGDDILPSYIADAVNGVSVSQLLADPFTVLLDGIAVGGLLNVSTLGVDDITGYDTVVYDDENHEVSIVMYNQTTDTYIMKYQGEWCTAKLINKDVEDDTQYTADDFQITWYNESGEEASGLYNALSTYTLYALKNSNDIFGEILDKITLGDIMGDNIEGTMLGNLSDITIGNLSSEFDQLTIGELLGYTAGSVDLTDTEVGKWYTTTDDNGVQTYTEVTGLESVLADLSIADLNGGDIMGELGETQVGVLLGYVAGDDTKAGTIEGKWYTESTDTDGNTVYTEVAGLDAELANLSINALQSGDIMDELGDVSVGVLLGYTQDKPETSPDTPATTTADITPDDTAIDDTVDDTTTDTDSTETKRPWYTVSTDSDGNTVYTEVAGLDAVLADLTIADLQSGDIMGELGETQVGVLLGYVAGDDTKAGTIEGKWYTESTDTDGNTVYTEVAGLDAELANLSINALQSGDIMDELGETQVGVLLGYTAGDDTKTGTTVGKWYTQSADTDGSVIYTEVAGLDAVLADLSISDLQGGDIMGSIGNTELGVMLNYTKVYTCGIDSDHIHDGNCEVGCSVHQHDSNCYYWATTDVNNNLVPVSGMDSVLADLTISNLQSGDIMDMIGDTQLGVMLDYTWGGDVDALDDNTWYSAVTTTNPDDSTTTVYTPIGGMDAVLAEIELNDLQGGDIMTAIEETYVGVMLGYTQVFTCTCPGDIAHTDDCYYWATSDGTAGIVTVDTNTEGVESVTHGEDPTYTKVSGMDSVIAGLTLKQLQSGDLMGEIGGTKLGIMLDYTLGADADPLDPTHSLDANTWYTVTTSYDALTNTTTTVYTPVGGMDAVLAEMTITELQTGDIMTVIEETYVGVMLGYTQVFTCACTDGAVHTAGCSYYWATIGEGEQQAGIYTVVIDSESTTVTTSATPTYTTVSGMDSVIAGLTLKQLQSGDLMGEIGDTKVGVMLDYTAGSAELVGTEVGKWYTPRLDTNGNIVYDDGNVVYDKVGGMDAVIADLTISNLQDGNLMNHIGGTEVGVILNYTKILTCDIVSDHIHDETCLAECESHEHTAECYTWYTTDTDGGATEVSALDAKIANLTLNQLQEGDLLSQINDLTLAELFGYTAGSADLVGTEVGKWYTYNENTNTYTEVDAVMNALADSTLADLQNGEILDALDNVLLGDLLEYTAGDGETLDASGNATEVGKWYTTTALGLEEATGLEAKLANKTLADLQNGGVAEIVDTLTLRDVLGDDADTGVFASIGGDTEIGDLNAAIEGMLLGDLLELTRGNGTNGDVDVWYNDANCTTPTTGVMATLASLTISDLQTGDTLNDTINNMALGDIIDINASSSPLLLSLEDTALKDITTAIDNTTMGTIQGLYYNEDDDTWYEDASHDTPANALMNDMGSLTVAEIGSNPTAITTVVNGLTISEMMSSGLINLEEGNEDTLDAIFECNIGDSNDWRTQTLDDFLPSLINKVQSIMDNIPTLP